MAEVVAGIGATHSSVRSLGVALHEAAAMGDDVRVIHRWCALPAREALPGFGLGYVYEVTPGEMQERSDQVDEVVAALTRDAQRDAGPMPVQVVQDVGPGDPGVGLVEASATADLLVLGARRHSALVAAVVGSTASYVLHHATCPVMLVPASEDPIASWKRVVVGVDGSPAAAKALQWAASRAKAHGCPLLVVHAWRVATAPDWLLATSLFEGYAKETASWLRDHVAEVLPDLTGIDVECRVAEGYAGSALLGIASPGDLLVVGSRGRSAFVDATLGSVAMQCAHHARTPVTVVRP